MGMTLVKLTIKNLYHPLKQAKGEFLVDSGAHYTVIPYAMVKQLGLKPSYEQEFSLADAKIIKRKIGNAIIKFKNQEGALMVVLGEKNDEGLLGITTLEAFGLMLDPFQRKIYKSKLMLARINILL